MMRSLRPIMLVAGLAALCLIGTAALSQEAYNQFLMIDSVKGMPAEQGDKIIARIFFKAYKDENVSPNALWEEDVRGEIGRLLMNDAPAEILAGPERVASETSKADLAMLLLVDVSGSMGGKGTAGSERKYNERAKPVIEALTALLDQNPRPELYIRLLPFSHQVPQPVDVGDGDQNIEAWSDKFLPLDETSKPMLLQGVRDIDKFICDGDRSVDTALYGAIVNGIELLESSADYGAPPAAKLIMVVLTDGKNDPGPRALQTFRSLTDFDVSRRLGATNAPQTYMIAFGAQGYRDELGIMDAIAQSSGAKFYARNSGADAGSLLLQAYEDVLEVEGNSWYVDIDTGMGHAAYSLRGAEMFRFRNAGASRPLVDKMLLLPASSTPMSMSARLIGMAVVALLLIVLLNVWYFTRPKAEALLPQDDETVIDKGDKAAATSRVGGAGYASWKGENKGD